MDSANSAHETFKPLLYFLEQLAHRGQYTAQQMYGCGLKKASSAHTNYHGDGYQLNSSKDSRHYKSNRDLNSSHDNNAWVSHGFVDNYMNTGLNGEAQWALCVTCGAWLLLQVWEHFTYTLSASSSVQNVDDDDGYEVLKTRLLPIMRGAIHFFLGG